MKNHHRLVSTATLLGSIIGAASSSAEAQSKYEITGLLDAGVGYVSNVGGNSSYRANPGIFRPNALIFRGEEDLGGGNKALFYLGSLFSIQSGSVFGGPGSLFSRESYVGLSNQYGKLTIGNQRDFMFDTLTLNKYPGSFVAGSYAAHQGPFPTFAVPYSSQPAFDFDRVNGEAIANTIKFKSADFNGLTFGAMYGFGETTGSFGKSNSTSFGVNYDVGPVGIGAAYTMSKAPSINNGNDGIRNIGIGARYESDKLLISGLTTLSRNTATGALINANDISVGYSFTSAWTLSTIYTYMRGNERLNSVHANQVTSMLSYRFSRRTMAYVDAAWQLASGRGAFAQVNASPGASNGVRQFISTFSIQHTF
ncbi:porin [Cupriavidus sp. PET2-C1]